ncbi:MAG TPA: response regulator [Gammaproteobacteria bacterium]|nr:response regulator [Gammaproteobacteria bacterium]
MKSVPLAYYPTTIHWIDDNPLFLNSVTTSVKTIHTLQASTSPKESLSYLKNQKPALGGLPQFSAYTNHNDYGLNHHVPTDLHLLSLSELLKHPKKSEDVSVIVVDYNMPNMNGLDFCKALRDSPIKKILLTGEMDQRNAIEAFNEGIIDCFLQKDSPNMINDLEYFIEKLTQEYFSDITKPMLAHLECEEKSPLTDNAFINFFNHWKKSNDILEHYLIDKNGSFVGIDTKNKTQFLIIHTDKTLDSFTNLHDDIDKNELLLQVRNRERIPFFGIGKEAWEFETTIWDNYFIKPNTLEGRCRYYWGQNA